MSGSGLRFGMAAGGRLGGMLLLAALAWVLAACVASEDLGQAPQRLVFDFDTGAVPDCPPLCSSSDTGGQLWSVTSSAAFSGGFSVGSGAIGNLQDTCLSVLPPFQTRRITFQRRVSSEDGFDFLDFFLDGVFIIGWSGQADWALITNDHTAGSHFYEWCYAKDINDLFFVGFDRAWVDDITVF